MKDEAISTSQDDMTDNTPSPNFTGLDIPILHVNSHPAGWKPEARSSDPHKYLFDLYYANFHVTHSWLPPRNTLVRLLETEPDALEFPVAAILYIGSLYTNIDSTSLRKRAYELSSRPFSSTIWSVQALLSISIAAFGEQHNDISATIFDRAHDLACRLGLQHKSFADGEKDPVLAESSRRTYWALYIHGSLRALRENSGHSQLYSIGASTELPCEEWDYQAGEIPTPVTLEEYDRMGRSREYSSWAYFVDLMRLCGEYVVPLLNFWSETDLDSLERADSKIESWRFQLRNWRRDHVDPDGMGDMILYHALGVSYGRPEKIGRNLAQVKSGLGRDRQCGYDDDDWCTRTNLAE
ncbi:hypothetical protein FSARC_7961 [Fusarium sarcochroum]|uniref:Xylanolytic transcriptional activator regulatory domain-containing protein n=1 Tax=Fusarium sarcochroum TaxID=1208366 RepID=A0A8H4X7F3_9HYPO|nr:hypothetical protein FSARC_7961 [Fusarium sarcochroum]